MDIEYDMMRSARDRQFLYIRNFAPEQPYAGHIIYRNQSAIMQEWLRLQADRALTGPAALWMRTSRPAEELYDTVADPHQIRNLAGDEKHWQTLERLRKAVTDWMTRINDQGLVNEPEMIQRMWPGGVQPETAQPYIVPQARARRSVAPRFHRDQCSDGGRHLRADPGRVDRVHHRRRSGGEMADLHGADSRGRADDASRESDQYGYKESAEARTVFTVETRDSD